MTTTEPTAMTSDQVKELLRRILGVWPQIRNDPDHGAEISRKLARMDYEPAKMAIDSGAERFKWFSIEEFAQEYRSSVRILRNRQAFNAGPRKPCQECDGRGNQILEALDGSISVRPCSRCAPDRHDHWRTTCTRRRNR